MIEEGVWLGDPSSNIQEGRKIWIPGNSPVNVLQAEAVSPSPEKLSLNLLRVLFSTNELATSNCTQPQKAGVKLLDQRKIHGIRCELLNDVQVCHQGLSSSAFDLSIFHYSTLKLTLTPPPPQQCIVGKHSTHGRRGVTY